MCVRVRHAADLVRELQFLLLLLRQLALGHARAIQPVQRHGSVIVLIVVVVLLPPLVILILVLISQSMAPRAS
jgi:hypothetical protein